MQKQERVVNAKFEEDNADDGDISLTSATQTRTGMMNSERRSTHDPSPEEEADRPPFTSKDETMSEGYTKRPVAVNSLPNGIVASSSLTAPGLFV